MLQYTYEIDEGFVVSLADLRKRLADISDGNQQWAAHPLPDRLQKNGGPPRSYVMVACTNPGSGSLPNNLCFLFPVIVEPEHFNDESGLLIGLHAGAAITLTHGLYFEGDKVKGHILEDWLTFWSPLGESLTANPPQG